MTKLVNTILSRILSSETMSRLAGEFSARLFFTRSPRRAYWQMVKARLV